MGFWFVFFHFQSSIFLLALGFFVLDNFGTPTGILSGVIILILSSLFVGKLKRNFQKISYEIGW